MDASTQQTEDCFLTEAVVVKKKGAGSRGGKSNTERSRLHRSTQKKTGGMELSIFIGEQAACALQIILAHGRAKPKMTQKKALEHALIKRALELAPNESTTQDLLSGGLLNEKDAQVWLEKIKG